MKACTSKRKYGSPSKIVVGQVNSQTSGMGDGLCGGCVPTVGAALSPSLSHLPPSTAFLCAVWCGPVDRRDGAGRLLFPGRPCPGHAACGLYSVLMCVCACLGRFRNRELTKMHVNCRREVASTKMIRDGSGWPRIMSDGAVTVGSEGTVPMGSNADGDGIMEERLTVLEHSLGTMESTRPNGRSRRVVRSTLDPEEGWGCGWTPQTLTTLHFPRPRWRSAAATPC